MVRYVLFFAASSVFVAQIRYTQKNVEAADMTAAAAVSDTAGGSLQASSAGTAAAAEAGKCYCPVFAVLNVIAAHVSP